MGFSYYQISANYSYHSYHSFPPLIPHTQVRQVFKSLTDAIIAHGMTFV